MSADWSSWVSGDALFPLTRIRTLGRSVPSQSKRCDFVCGYVSAIIVISSLTVSGELAETEDVSIDSDPSEIVLLFAAFLSVPSVLDPVATVSTLPSAAVRSGPYTVISIDSNTQW
jgi:hypothetical protein